MICCSEEKTASKWNEGHRIVGNRKNSNTTDLLLEELMEGEKQGTDWKISWKDESFDNYQL